MRNFIHCICLSVTLSLGSLFSGQIILVEDLAEPFDVIANQQGDLYISNSANRTIEKTNADGTNPIVIKTFESSEVGGLLISNGKLFATTFDEGLIKMNLDGSGLETLVSERGIYYITSGNDGYIYFTVGQRGIIQRVKEDGTDLSTIATGLSIPLGIAYDPISNVLFYTDDDAVYSIKKDGTDKQSVSSGHGILYNLRLDSSGNIYVADTGSHLIKRISADRKTVTILPTKTLNQPTSVFVTKNGRILICDYGNNEIKYINPPEASSLNFDGVDDYISGTNNLLPQGSGEVTIEAVIKAPSVVTSPYASSSIFNYGTYSNSQRFCLMLSDGALAFIGEYNDLYSSPDLRDDKWHHVAVTYKNNYIKLYVDGEVVEESLMNELDIFGKDFQIGGSNRNGIDELFEGDIDEIRVWNRALSKNELKNSKSCEVANPVSQDGLVSYFKFNQGNNEDDNSTIATLLDATGNSISTALNNFSLIGTKSNWLLASPVVTGNACPAYISPIPCTTVTLPSNGVSASSNPEASWTAVNDANNYKIYVGTSSRNYDILNGSPVTALSHTFTGLSENKTYYVKVVPNNSEESAISCPESSFTTGTTLAIGDIKKSTISVYPNPFKNEVNLSNIDNVVSVSITDNSGKLVRNMKPAKVLDLSSLTEGLYIINLKLNDGTVKSVKAIKK